MTWVSSSDELDLLGDADFKQPAKTGGAHAQRSAHYSVGTRRPSLRSAGETRRIRLFSSGWRLIP